MVVAVLCEHVCNNDVFTGGVHIQPGSRSPQGGTVDCVQGSLPFYIGNISQKHVGVSCTPAAGARTTGYRTYTRTDDDLPGHSVHYHDYQDDDDNLQRAGYSQHLRHFDHVSHRGET